MLHLEIDEVLELTKHRVYTLAIDFSGLASTHLFVTNPNSFTETEGRGPYPDSLCPAVALPSMHSAVCHRAPLCPVLCQPQRSIDKEKQ